MRWRKFVIRHVLLTSSSTMRMRASFKVASFIGRIGRAPSPALGCEAIRDETVDLGQEHCGFHRFGQKFHSTTFQRSVSRFVVADETGEKKNRYIAQTRIGGGFAG